MVVYSSIHILLMDLSPTSYCLPKPLLVCVWFDVTIIDINTILYPLTVIKEKDIIVVMLG